MAKTWLNKSKPFLVSHLSVAPVSSSLLKVEDLKVIVKCSANCVFFFCGKLFLIEG